MEYNTSDKLGIALACLAGVMAIILFLVEKTPLTVILLLSLMVALAIYPILHFAKRIGVRIAAFSLFLIGTLLLGWSVMPHGHSISVNIQEPQQPKPEKKKTDKKEQDTKKPTEKPKAKSEQPVQNIHLGDVTSGPCSNTQIGGSGNTATTNCGSSVIVTYNYAGTIKKVVSGGIVNTMADSSLQDAHVKIGKELRSGQSSEALADAQNLTAAEPQWAVPHILAGYAYVNLRKIDSAKIELKRAKDLVPPGYEFEEEYNAELKRLEEAIKRHER